MHFAENILQMFLQSMFADAESLCNLIIVSIIIEKGKNLFFPSGQLILYAQFANQAFCLPGSGGKGAESMYDRVQM